MNFWRAIKRFLITHDFQSNEAVAPIIDSVIGGIFNTSQRKMDQTLQQHISLSMAINVGTVIILPSFLQRH